MVYATPIDMRERFGELELIQLTDRDNTGQISTGHLTRALDDATAFIDGYIGRVYQLPLRGCAKPLTVPGGTLVYVVPPALKRIACDLARYYLFTDVGEKHEAIERYRAAVKDLGNIAEGKTQLTCPWGGAAGEAIHADALEPTEVYHSFAPRQLSDASLRGFA